MARHLRRRSRGTPPSWWIGGTKLLLVAAGRKSGSRRARRRTNAISGLRVCACRFRGQAPTNCQPGKGRSQPATPVTATGRTAGRHPEEDARPNPHLLGALRNLEMLTRSGASLHVILNVLLDQVITHLKADAANVLLFNPETGRLEYFAGRGFRTRALQYTKLPLGEGHAGRAAQERRIIYIPNLPENPGSLEQAPLLADELFITYCAAPMVAGGRCAAVLEIFCRASRSYDQPWIDFLEIIAAHAGIAIDRAAPSLRAFAPAYRSP